MGVTTESPPTYLGQCACCNARHTPLPHRWGASDNDDGFAAERLGTETPSFCINCDGELLDLEMLVIGVSQTGEPQRCVSNCPLLDPCVHSKAEASMQKPACGGSVHYMRHFHCVLLRCRDCNPVSKPCYMLGTYTTPHNDTAAADADLNPEQGWPIAQWFSRIVALCWEPIFQVSMPLHDCNALLASYTAVFLCADMCMRRCKLGKNDRQRSALCKDTHAGGCKRASMLRRYACGSHPPHDGVSQAAQVASGQRGKAQLIANDCGRDMITEFMVTAERVRQRSQAFYENALKFARVTVTAHLLGICTADS